MRSIFDPGFRYVPSYATDVAATIRRVREEIEAGLRLLDGTPHELLPAQRAVQARLDKEVDVTPADRRKIAARAGTSPAYVYQIETGRRRPSQKMLARLERAAAEEGIALNARVCASCGRPL